MTPDRIQDVVGNEEELDHLININSTETCRGNKEPSVKKLRTNFWNRYRFLILYLGGDINLKQKHMCSQGILTQQDILTQQEMHIST